MDDARRRRLRRAPLYALFGFLLILLPLAGLVPPARASSEALTGHITGPTNVGVALTANYRVYATGGPAIAANGTQVGILSYTASLVGLNTTSATVSPNSGVLINGTTNISLVAPNITESVSLYVDVVSNFTGTNQTINLTYTINIVTPITLSAVLDVVGPGAVKAFALTVDLDGAAVGTVAVPSLTAGQTYPVNYSYVNPGLSSGWHTFTISLTEEHGLVVFQGGSESFSKSFYVTGSSNDYDDWYLAGGIAFVLAVFIWVTRVGARRRPKAKKA